MHLEKVHPGYTDDDVVGTHQLPTFAEGRVEQQKLNQTATAPLGRVFGVQLDLLVNHLRTIATPGDD